MSVELTLVAPGGIRTALQQLLPGYEKATGNKVTGSYVSGGATKQKIVDGELFDVPVIQPPYDTVLASRNIDAKSETPLATVSVVAAVRAGVPKPDMSNGEALKKLLLSVKSISCPSIARGAACGVSFEATLVKLGIKDAMDAENRRGAKRLGIGQDAGPRRGRARHHFRQRERSQSGCADARRLAARRLDTDGLRRLHPCAHAASRSRCGTAEISQHAEAAKIFTECGMTPGK